MGTLSFSRTIDLERNDKNDNNIKPSTTTTLCAECLSSFFSYNFQMKRIEPVIIDKCEVYIPENISNEIPLIIIIGGSSGGLRSNDLAIYFADNGFPSAVIPYFAIDDLPNELIQIPLEYFRDSIEKIREIDYLKKRKCFLHGTSKGAEGSLLLCAKKLIEIDGLILVSPSAYVWAAPADKEKLLNGEEEERSSWKFNDQDVEFVRFDPKKDLAAEVKIIDNEEYHIYKNTWHPKVKDKVGKIDLTIIDTKVLIFSGKDDGLWPSYEAAIEIERTLDDLGKKGLIKHIAFENVGHIIPYPGKASRIFSEHPELKTNILYGGEENAIRKASKVWWEEVKKFVSCSNL